MGLPPSPTGPDPRPDLRPYDPDGRGWTTPAWVMPPPRPRTAWQRWGRAATLLLVTACSVFLAGAIQLADLPDQGFFLLFDPAQGMALAAGLLSVLFAHEMGHYLACRYYNVDASLPHFIPSPWIPVVGWFAWQPLSFVGTFGAFIRIRAPIPHRRALFDIGVAGPLAGFLVCLPILYFGIAGGHVVPHQPVPFGEEFGEPLIVQWMSLATHGPIPAGSELAIGKLGVAAWFGIFVTALNLMPIGQLDGGHVTYALLRRFAHPISRIGSWLCVALIYFGPTWILWAILARILSRHHPPTLDDDEPVGRGRAVIGALSMVVFVVCFVPNPIVASWHDIFVRTGLDGLVRHLLR